MTPSPSDILFRSLIHSCSSKDAGTDGRTASAGKLYPAGYDGYVNAAPNPPGDEPTQGIPDLITALNNKLFPICHDLSALLSSFSYHI